MAIDHEISNKSTELESTKSHNESCIDAKKNASPVLSENVNDFPEEDTSFNDEVGDRLAQSIETEQLNSNEGQSDHPLRVLFDIGKEKVRTRITNYRVRSVLKNLNMEEVEIKGDGHCFTSSVIECLKDYNVYKTHEEIAVMVMDEIHSRLPHYFDFIEEGDRPTFVDFAANFFQRGRYEAEVIDCCITATANALGVNLNIFSKRGSYTRLSVQDTDRKKSDTNLFFQFYCRSKSNKDAHYNAIVKAKSHKQPPNRTETTVTENIHM